MSCHRCWLALAVFDWLKWLYKFLRLRHTMRTSCSYLMRGVEWVDCCFESFNSQQGRCVWQFMQMLAETLKPSQGLLTGTSRLFLPLLMSSMASLSAWLEMFRPCLFALSQNFEEEKKEERGEGRCVPPCVSLRMCVVNPSREFSSTFWHSTPL